MITAAEEFKKNPELKEEDLKHIREWLSKQPHLPQDITDETIILIMHSSYYGIETTKQTMDHYFTLRTHTPEFFLNRNMDREELQQVIKAIYIIPLEQRTEQGYKVFLGGLRNPDPRLFELADSFKVFNMILDAVLRTEGTAPGVILVINFHDMKLGHLYKLTLPVVKKTLVYLQEGTPVRLKGLHFINIVPFIDKVLLLMKPFMKKELMDMLVLHQEGSDKLYGHIPKAVFPNELGGSAGQLDKLTEKSYQTLKDFRQWYREEELNRVDETKRPGKAKSAGELFGIDGSFRKLDLD